MKNKMLLMLIVCVAMAATTFGAVDYNGWYDISGSGGGEDVRLGQGALTTINIQSGGKFTCLEETRFGEESAATINVQVGGLLIMSGETLMPYEEEFPVTTRLNIYSNTVPMFGTRSNYIEQLKMYGFGDDTKAVIGNGTDPASLQITEGLLGKDGDATITINANGTMIIDGDFSGSGNLNVFKIDSDDLGTDSYIDLVGGTLKVNSANTEFDPNDVIGYGGTREVGSVAGTGDDTGYTVYTALSYGVLADDPGYQWLTDGTRTVEVTATVTETDGIAGHTYSWTSATGATFANETTTVVSATEVTLSADVTFTTAAAPHSLTVQVTDSVKTLVYSDTIDVTVYADGCAAAKAEDGYDEAAALVARDANYDCEKNLADFAAVAAAWMNSVEYVY